MYPKAQSKKATIKDVALRAEVSVTTVSLVLNGKTETLPEATCNRVRTAAEELNYCLDYNARAMVTRKTNIIGIVVPDISNSFFSDLVRHMQVDFFRRGYDIMLCNSEEVAEYDLRYIRLLTGRNVDGLILTPSAESLTAGKQGEFRSLLDTVGIPYLFLDRYYEGDSPRVVGDNAESGFRVGEYLLDCGHTRIGAIAGPLTLNSSYNRLAGLKRALAARGLSMPESYIYEGKYDFETGREGAEALFMTDVTAIFAFSDMQACGVYEAAKRAGKRIPEDISVVGFDDNYYSSVLETPLTTMRQPIKRIAEEACDMLLNMIENKKLKQNAVRLPAELVVRSSVKNITGDK